MRKAAVGRFRSFLSHATFVERLPVRGCRLRWRGPSQLGSTKHQPHGKVHGSLWKPSATVVALE